MKINMLLVAGLVFMNLLSFLLFYIDKQRARRHEWRISEATLFITAIAGGSIGAIAGMYTFRHKTKHWYFVIGMPLILAAQVVILFLLWKNGVI